MKKALARFPLKRLSMVVPFLPLVLGLVGYTNYSFHYYRQFGYADPLGVLYSTLRLYLVTLDASLDIVQRMDWPYRLCLECGRWIGLYVSTSFVTRLFHNALQDLWVRVKASNPRTIALHGADKYRALLGESIGKDAILAQTAYAFKARRHILAFDNDLEMFHFVSHHFSQMTGAQEGGLAARQIYLCSHGMPRTNAQNRGIIISDMAENCARIYWNKLYLRRFGEAVEKRVVLIGFGQFGQELFSRGLLTNVFLGAPDLRYDIFGSVDTFLSRHREITSFLSIQREAEGMDSAFFHSQPWTASLELLRQTDRIILAEDSEEKNLNDLSCLMELNISAPIHIRASDVNLVRGLWPQRKVAENSHDAHICVFGTDRSLYTKGIVLEEALQLHARCIHAQHMRRVGRQACVDCGQPGSPLDCSRTCKHLEREWMEMDPFFQNSNIAQADHIPVKARQLLRRDFTVTGECAQACRERLRELGGDLMEPYLVMEHQRWMRNQSFHGWVYGPQRDPEQRTHPLMIPFDALAPNQKAKDADAYAVMLDVLENEKGNCQDG